MKSYFLTVSFVLLMGLVTPKVHAQASTVPTLADRAWEVIEVRCNECHRKDKKEWVFDRNTVHYLANSINEQVFIKKKMPKGKPKLTEEESQTLRDWLDSLK